MVFIRLVDAYQRGSLKKHEAIKQRILRNPSLVGIDRSNILHIETEFPLIPRKRPIAQPDIVIDYEAGSQQRRVFIEVKSGSCKKALQSLLFQLKKVQRFLHRRNIDGEVIGVYCIGERTHLMTANSQYSRKVLKLMGVSSQIDETKQQTMEEKRSDALEMAA